MFVNAIQIVFLIDHELHGIRLTAQISQNISSANFCSPDVLHVSGVYKTLQVSLRHWEVESFKKIFSGQLIAHKGVWAICPDPRQRTFALGTFYKYHFLINIRSWKRSGTNKFSTQQDQPMSTAAKNEIDRSASINIPILITISFITTIDGQSLTLNI